MPKPGETVLVMGVNGKVGQAAVQIASWHGARVIGVVRKSEPYAGHANGKVEIIDASVTDVAARVRELTDGKGADIVFNTVGDPYFQAAHQSLALRGRQILIAAIDRIVPFNILEFYRGQHTYVGIDTLGLSSIATGAVLRELGSGFCQRASEAVPDPAGCDLSAGTGEGRLPRGRRFLARSRDPAAGGIGSSQIFRKSSRNKSSLIPIEDGWFYSPFVASRDGFVPCCGAPWTGLCEKRYSRAEFASYLSCAGHCAAKLQGKASAGCCQHRRRERTADRSCLWRGRSVERLLSAQRPARLVGRAATAA